MTETSIDPFGSFIRKLDRFAKLGDAERQAVAKLPFRVTRPARGTQLVREGDPIRECCILIEGYAFRYKASVSGNRQIVSFHMEGDILDIQHLLLSIADHSIEMLTDGVVVWVPLAELWQLAADHQAVGQALWRDSLVDASIFREWVLNVGQRDAIARIAHMLCEFAVRREAAGLGDPEHFELPMTQQHIADATGQTNVHVNRMLRALTEQGIIVRDSKDWRIADWQRLQALGEFEPQYLHLAA